MNISPEEIRFLNELKEKGLTDRQRALLLIRKDLTNESLIRLYQEKYEKRNTRS